MFHGNVTTPPVEQMSIALMLCLNEHQVVGPEEATTWYCKIYEKWRGYGTNASELLEMLRRGDLDYTKSGRYFLPEGSHGNGGAVRIAPVGFVYRYCSIETLKGGKPWSWTKSAVHANESGQVHEYFLRSTDRISFIAIFSSINCFCSSNPEYLCVLLDIQMLWRTP